MSEHFYTIDGKKLTRIMGYVKEMAPKVYGQKGIPEDEWPVTSREAIRAYICEEELDETHQEWIDTVSAESIAGWAVVGLIPWKNLTG